MSKIDKHGLPMRGLKDASGRTYNEQRSSDWHYMVFYNTVSGEVWTAEVYGRNSWVVYAYNPEIIRVADVRKHMTMQQIADRVHEVVELRKEADKLWVKKGE